MASARFRDLNPIVGSVVQLVFFLTPIVWIYVDFLHGANPKNWPAEASKTKMHDHLNLTTQEVVAHLSIHFPLHSLPFPHLANRTSSRV